MDSATQGNVLCLYLNFNVMASANCPLACLQLFLSLGKQVRFKHPEGKLNSPVSSPPVCPHVSCRAEADHLAQRHGPAHGGLWRVSEESSNVHSWFQFQPRGAEWEIGNPYPSDKWSVRLVPASFLRRVVLLEHWNSGTVSDVILVSLNLFFFLHFLINI